MAFTLVELLVVISVVALLAALVLPAVSSSIRKGYEVDAVQDLRSLHTATMQHAAEHTGEMCYCFNSGGALGWHDLWVNKLTPYLPAKGTIPKENGRNDAFYNKAIKEADRFIADYAPNDNLLRENNDSWSDVTNPSPRLVTIQEPSKEILYLEGAKKTATANPRTSGSFTLWAKMAILGDFDYPHTIARRHGSPTNPSFFAVFFDGHTERIDFNQFSQDEALRRKMLSGDAAGNSIYR
jgi:prepilin-type N-terminal cleavage/methylation domain-containing protein